MLGTLTDQLSIETTLGIRSPLLIDDNTLT
jgi:hypothetical protein